MVQTPNSEYFVILKIQSSESIQDILIAELSEIGFDTFEQTESHLIASCILSVFETKESDLLVLFNAYQIDNSQIEKTIQSPQNWNKEWESNFEPVNLADKVYVRALFHPVETNLPYTITIQPKMSFGTGHHGTTSGMIEMMLKTDFVNKRVLDMGTGTGVLAIFAEQLGAAYVLAIDYDEWAVDNAIENIVLNQSKNIVVKLGDEGSIQSPDQPYHCILSNITKNYNLANIALYASLLEEGGELVMSGFYEKDVEELIQTAAPYFCFREEIINNNWAVLKFNKLDFVKK